MFMRQRYLAMGGLLLAPGISPLAAPVDVGGGIEHFAWQEYNDNGGKLLKETGSREFVSLAMENQVDERWIYALRGRLYSGQADCSGVTLSGAACSGSSVDYDGVEGSVDFTGRFLNAAGRLSDWGLRFAIGGESWRRHLLGASGYTQSYEVTFGRLGLTYTPAQGWFGEAGTKYPFSARNKVELRDGVTLTPQGAFSLYATLGYNFSQRWSIRGYYDGYRFKASDPEALTDGGILWSTIVLPESRLDLWGLIVGLYF
jgi:hypothetical protein